MSWCSAGASLLHCISSVDLFASASSIFAALGLASARHVDRLRLAGVLGAVAGIFAVADVHRTGRFAPPIPDGAIAGPLALVVAGLVIYATVVVMDDRRELRHRFDVLSRASAAGALISGVAAIVIILIVSKW